MRLRSSFLTSLSFACMRSRRLFRCTRNWPRSDFPQTKRKPRNMKVSGLPSPSAHSKTGTEPSELKPSLHGGDLERNYPSPDATLVGKGCELHRVPEVSKAFKETVLLPFLGVGIEVVGTEVLIHRSVLEHVIDGREDRSRNGNNSLLGAAAASDAVVLGLEITALLARRRPGALHQGGLEPGRAFANARGAALARALVAPRADASPGDQVTAVEGKWLMSMPISRSRKELFVQPRT